MGHSHGIKWNDSLVEEGIMKVMKELKISSMPTQTMVENVIGNLSLNNAISRSGGWIKWSNKLGLECKGTETVLGRDFELICEKQIIEKFDFDVEQMNSKHPYDLLVNSNIKIDIKVSKMYNNKISYYTFNLEKKNPTCDIFVAYCINNDKEIIKTYVIPSKILSGKTQLSVGVKTSKYDIYLNNWELLLKYNDFYKSL